MTIDLTELFRICIKLVELLALFSTIYSYTFWPTKTKKDILIVMIVVVFTDWGAFLLKEINFFEPFTRFWFLILVPIELILWANLFKKNLINLKHQKIINTVFITYGIYVLLLTALNVLQVDLNFKINYFSYVYTIGVILLALVCLLFLYQITSSKEIINIWSNLLFYISFVLLFFYLGTLPFHALKITLYNNYPNLFESYYIIFIVFNYVLYLTISFGVLWKQAK